jgi:hypothetical protein
MGKNFRIILAALFLLAIIAGITAWYMYNKPHRDIGSEKADFDLLAADLIKEFTDDESAANQKYLDKVISVTGEIVEKTQSESGLTFLLEDEFEGVSATFDSLYTTQNQVKLDAISVGDQVKVKGKCDGMLMLQGVILNKCVLE